MADQKPEDHVEEEVEAEDGADGAAETTQDEEKELEEMKRRVLEMEEEARKLKEMQEQAEVGGGSEVNREEADARSIYVGNVDYSVTADDLQQHFAACGTINRVTILCDKWTGHPKGFAYIEFLDKSSVPNAMELNETILKGRPLKVTQKRTNMPGAAPRGRGRGRGGFNPYYPPAGGYAPRGRGGRPPFRGRGAPRGGYFYHPYY